MRTPHPSQRESADTTGLLEVLLEGGLARTNSQVSKAVTVTAEKAAPRGCLWGGDLGLEVP